MCVECDQLSVVFVESVFINFFERKEIYKLLFEHFGFQKVGLIVEEAVLLFSHLYKTYQKVPDKKQMTGLVVNIKEFYSSAVPIVEGYIIPSGIYRHSIGSKHCQNFICNQLYFLNSFLNSSSNSQEKKIKKKFINKFGIKNLLIHSEKNISSKKKCQSDFLRFSEQNKDLFDLIEKFLKNGIVNLKKNRDNQIERKLLDEDNIHILKFENQEFYVNSKIENVYEVFFCPELFDLNYKMSIVDGIMKSLSNIHSDLKRKVLSVYFK